MIVFFLRRAHHAGTGLHRRAFEILLMVGLPGKTFKANPTATGHVPVYKANGMFCYLVTLATLCLLINTDRYQLDLFLSCFVLGGGMFVY